MSNWILSDQEPPRREQASAQEPERPAPPVPPHTKTKRDQAQDGKAPRSGGAGKPAIAERKRARQVALQALFEIDSVGHAPDIVLYERMEAATRALHEAQVEQARTLPAPNPGESPEADKYESDEEMAPLGETGIRFLLWLVAGVLSYRDRIDALIHRYAPEWPVEQLAIVDRSILRLALYELGAHEGEAPPKVVINEAVELAKVFGSDSSPRFVNGVLGAAFEDARKQAF